MPFHFSGEPSVYDLDRLHLCATLTISLYRSSLRRCLSYDLKSEFDRQYSCIPGEVVLQKERGFSGNLVNVVDSHVRTRP